MTKDHLGHDDGGVTEEEPHGELKLSNPFRDPVRRRMASMALPAISRMLRVGTLNQIVQDSLAHMPEMNGPDAILHTMGASYETSAADLARIPKEGPCVVVANHPFGGIEGLALMSLVLRVRPDAKTLVNRILGLIPPLREHLLLVDVLGGGAKANTMSMRATLSHLRNGGLLAVFPAGEVSHARLTRPFVADPPWSDTIARMAKRSGAPIVPVRFAGHNGVAFQLAGMVHPRLRTVMLPQEVVNKNHARLQVAIGHPIRKKDADALADASELNAVMRARCDLLAFRWSRTRKKSPPPLPPIEVPPLAADGKQQIQRCLEREIIAERGDLALTVAKHDEITGVKDQAKTLIWMSTTSTTNTCCFGTEVKSVWGGRTDWDSRKRFSHALDTEASTPAACSSSVPTSSRDWDLWLSWDDLSCPAITNASLRPSCCFGVALCKRLPNIIRNTGGSSDQSVFHQTTRVPACA
ncbi:MAG: lysophospholipid acyltransferase family protein [Phycisphaerales bacterium]|nr:lysophospholipid acyltransferase family protein [Phycisphaerales bacterium]